LSVEVGTTNLENLGRHGRTRQRNWRQRRSGGKREKRRRTSRKRGEGGPAAA
jgi:hypothetical protein